jgi:hypothetical protein
MGMKNRIKIVSMFGTLLAAGAIAAAPVVASAADDGDVDVAAFTGQTTSLTPVQLVMGSGNFTFTTTSLAGGAPSCAGVSTDATPPEVFTSCTITSSGTYSNIVCGTGTATGTSTSVTEPDGSAEAMGTYTIVFAAGVGVLVDTTDPAVGVVDISPSQSGIGSPPNCVTQFNVIAVAVIG